jgi:hypothetical protein
MHPAQRSGNQNMESWNITCTMMRVSAPESKMQHPEAHHPKQKVIDLNVNTTDDVIDVCLKMITQLHI